MELESSLPCSQEPSIGHYPEPDESNSHPHNTYKSHSASQEIPHLLQNLKFHYCVHKIPSSVTILSQMNPIHNHIKYPFTNLIFSSNLRRILLSVCIYLPIRSTCPYHLIRLGLISLLIFGEE